MNLPLKFFVIYSIINKLGGIIMLFDEEMMLKAMELAKKAYSIGECPVGAIVVNREGEIIGQGYNRRETPLTRKLSLLRKPQRRLKVGGLQIVPCMSHWSHARCARELL